MFVLYYTAESRTSGDQCIGVATSQSPTGPFQPVGDRPLVCSEEGDAIDAAFFRDKPTIVVGGGDTAMEDATFLAKFAKDVKVVHRRDEFRASKVMLNRAEATDNIELLTPFVIDRFEGGGDNGALNKVFLENTEGGEDRELEIDGAFIAIGQQPVVDAVARGGRGWKDEFAASRAERSPRGTRSISTSGR